jgi:hypothetical protein
MAKYQPRIDESDVKHLNRLAEDLKERLLFSVILYLGVESVPLGSKVAVRSVAVTSVGDDREGAGSNRGGFL